MSVIRGTIKELAGKVTLNGNPLTVAQLSVVTKVGNGSYANVVGEAPKGENQRGKAAKIWEIKTNANMVFAEKVEANAA